MRLPIRVQLGTIILLASLFGLAVIAIAVWFLVHDFVLSLRTSTLSQTAELKAAQLTANLSLMQTAVGFVSSRVLVQHALQRYDSQGNNSASNWAQSEADLQAAIGGGSATGQALLIQAVVFPPDSSGPAGSGSLINITGYDWQGQITLPYTYPNGTNIQLGANDPAAGPYGYPPPLYPNLTYTSEPYNSTYNVSAAVFDGETLGLNSSLLLGPLQVNQSFALVSITMPIVNNTDSADVLGWMTILMDGSLISSVIESPLGLGNTGETLLIGPDTATNKYPPDEKQAVADDKASSFEVRYVVPLSANDTGRHPQHTDNSTNPPFNADSYPVIYQALHQASIDPNDTTGANLQCHNEVGQGVSVGYATIEQDIVDWIVLVEYSRGETWQPINHLRNVILICTFATTGLMAAIAYPLAHFSSLPILRLREATSRSIEPPGGGSVSSLGSFAPGPDGAFDESNDAVARKEGFLHPVAKWRRKRDENAQWRRDARRKRAFRIPGKVKERKVFIKDELSDLTTTFNEMSDELMMQYTKLEERVQQRTAELELSKKAAEAANESKTLFIANISHELKTPLNGILGMCAVCMQEDDPVRLKRSLGIIYKSGDLLLNLLTDLLTFSKNQVGQQLSLDEKEFKLRDISSQTLAIFDKQAKDGQISLRIEFDGVRNLSSDTATDNGPLGTGRMRDMILWGDLHRILQVVINLVSNSLKFTPAGGSVVLTIRCLSELPPDMGSRKPSINSKQSKRPSARHFGSEGTGSHTNLETANAINVKDKPHALAYQERAASPPPGRYLYFEFEVADTGPGIPENLHHKIFEPFVQGDLGLTKKYGGTGLGLSICSQLANLMGGNMSLHSTPGVGSTFTMKIPLRHLISRADSSASSAVDVPLESPTHLMSADDNMRPSARSAAEPNDDSGARADSHARQRPSATGDISRDSAPPRIVGLSQPFFASTQPMDSQRSKSAAIEQITAEATSGGKIRVLVADDNKVNQEVVMRMLKLEDIYDVTVAKDGQEAYDLVKASMCDGEQRPFNLIFMDVQMPNVDGLQSTRLIRETGYSAPIVALTAFSEESNVKDCLDSGMNYFLSKPIRRPQLKKVLKEYCAPIPEENEDVTPPAQPEQQSTPSANASTSNATAKDVNSGTGLGANSKAETNGYPASPSDAAEGVSPSTII